MQRAGGACGIERLDEQAPVAHFAGGASPHEPPQLLIDRTPGVLRLLAEDLERAQLALATEQVEDGVNAESPDEFVLEIGDADEETEPVERRSNPVDLRPCVRQRANDVPLLPLVVETGDRDRVRLLLHASQHAPEVGDTTGGEYVHPLSAQVDTAPLGERPHRLGIALALYEHERFLRVRFLGWLMGTHPGQVPT